MVKQGVESPNPESYRRGCVQLRCVRQALGVPRLAMSWHKNVPYSAYPHLDAQEPVWTGDTWVALQRQGKLLGTPQRAPFGCATLLPSGVEVVPAPCQRCVAHCACGACTVQQPRFTHHTNESYRFAHIGWLGLKDEQGTG